jgi:competence protein ComEC
MQPGKEYLWQRLPAFRILLPFICGILCQWYFPLSTAAIIAFWMVSFALAVVFLKFPLKARYHLRMLPGILINLLFLATGCIAVIHKDERKAGTWFGNHDYEQLVVVVNEPPAEKANSFRVTATVKAYIFHRTSHAATGKVILSFPKSASVPGYGQEIIIHKLLPEIKSSNNPGGFDYRSWCIFNGITHQAYLNANDYNPTGGVSGNWFYGLIIEWRLFILSVFKKHLHDAKISGLAEALLIGYKDDLDKDLVKAYANTGVVHVIAISGLHLALVYGLLMLLTKPIAGKRWRWLRVLAVITGLWVFSILAGAQPSILRAAVMFTLIAVRMIVNRNGSVYNSISVAAFLLLAWNPFWLWDPGFQLSFLAVLSIILFYRKVYTSIYFPNKLIDLTWQLAAASIAAQILTVPITIYYFHQFPLLFLITNIVAVPLSSLIVYIEIFLCVISPVKPLAAITAKLLELLIGFMNAFIERINSIPSANWTGLSLSMWQALLFYLVIGAIAVSLQHKRKITAYIALVASLLVITLRSFDFYQADQQQQFMVYNIPKRKAAEFYSGRNTYYAGDGLTANELAMISPARIQHRVRCTSNLIGHAFLFNGKSIVIIDVTVKLKPGNQPVDVLVISGKQFIKMEDMIRIRSIRQVVIASDVSANRANFIRKDCERLKISCYTVVDKGAFVVHSE